MDTSSPQAPGPWDAYWLNRRLTDAAPDLLAALRAIVEVPGNNWQTANAMRDIAHAAIARLQCSERSDDPTLSGTNNKTSDGWDCFECGTPLHGPFCPACNPEMMAPSDGWMQEVVEVLEPFAEPLADLDDLPEHLRAENDMPVGTALQEAEQPTVGHLRAAASLLHRLQGAS